jgi:spermidine/putrescine transport system ATP-binding protein
LYAGQRTIRSVEKMKEPIVSIVNVEKFYGDNKVVKKLNMDIEEGEFLTMLGPSGCGKTTTLRMIAGFEDATSGIIKVENERVEDKEPYERNVNTVFQNYALFPHMTVFDNIAYGLKIKKVSKAEIKERVNEMLELVQLTGFEKRKPSQMSGGQKQRVAIARALVNRPKVLLLDEPLGALDLKLRKQMQVELKRLQRKLKTTFVYVTHDQEEALTMSDRIAIMNGGYLEQIGTPDEIYENPKTKFVASFIGESNILEGVVTQIKDGNLTIAAESGTIQVEDKGFSINETLYVSIRPENMKYSKTPVEGFSLPGVVRDHIYVGSIIKTIVVLSNGHEIKVNRFPDSEKLKENDVVYLYWDKKGAVPIKRHDDKLVDLLDKKQKEGIR